MTWTFSPVRQTPALSVQGWSVYICCDDLIESINSIFELWQRNMRMILR